jgi:hypothetical protein
MAPSALSGTSLKFDNENKTINPNLYVGFGGGRRGAGAGPRGEVAGRAPTRAEVPQAMSGVGVEVRV